MLNKVIVVSKLDYHKNLKMALKGSMCLCLQCKFTDIDPEELSATTVRYAKSVYQLEKGLPPNGVVPMLKERVESMKDKVRVLLCVGLQYLRYVKPGAYFQWLNIRCDPKSQYGVIPLTSGVTYV